MKIKNGFYTTEKCVPRKVKKEKKKLKIPKTGIYYKRIKKTFQNQEVGRYVEESKWIQNSCYENFDQLKFI